MAPPIPRAWRRHPFAVEAWFDCTLALTLAAPVADLEARLSPGLRLDAFGPHAFLAIAMVDTRRMRPAGWPSCIGRDFHLVGYRLFVRRRTGDGRELRGLQVLRSETDSNFLTITGNWMTRYHYHLARIEWERNGEGDSISSRSNEGRTVIETGPRAESAALPEGSPFTDWREARRFAGPMPFTFSYESETRQMITVMGRREGWTPLPVSLQAWHSDWVTATFPGVNFQPAAAFAVESIDYRWERGTCEPVQPFTESA